MTCPPQPLWMSCNTFMATNPRCTEDDCTHGKAQKVQEVTRTDFPEQIQNGSSEHLPALREWLNNYLEQLYGSRLLEADLNSILDDVNSDSFVWPDNELEQGKALAGLFQEHNLAVAQIDVLLITAAAANDEETTLRVTNEASHVLLAKGWTEEANVILEQALRDVDLSNLSEPSLLVQLTQGYADCCKIVGEDERAELISNLANNFAHLIEQIDSQ